MAIDEYRVSDSNEIGDVIKEARIKRSISQRELAKRSNVSPQMISAIEKKKREPTVAIVAMLAIALGVVITIGVLGQKK